MPRPYPRRIATISVHTSPLEQPGTGDAGGLNVYVVEVAKRLAERGVEVDIFTRAVSRDVPPVAELAPGVLVRHLAAGPFEDLDKADLPGQLCHFTFEVLRAEAAYAPGRYDIVHGHYWLSGQVGAVAKERWGVPFVQSMHTLGRVKNAALAAGDAAEPEVRLRGEAEVVAAGRPAGGEHRRRGPAAHRALRRPAVPGADHQPRRGPRACSSPVPSRTPGSRLGVPEDAVLLVFAGRVQPLKAPEVVLHAAAQMIRDDPGLAGRLRVAFVGGPSGTGRAHPDGLTELSASAGHLGAGQARAALPASRTRRLVPRGHRGDGAVLLGVVRPGGRRGTGLRHAGGGRRRRRPAHRGRPTASPACW